MKYTKLLSLAAFASFGLAASSAQAATIYSNDFNSGSNSTNLHDTTTTEGGGTWIASPNWKEDGTIVAGAGDEDNAFLAFTPEAGKIYTLSATLNPPVKNTNKGWLALGFTETANTGNDGGSPVDGEAFWENVSADPSSPWMVYRTDGGNVDTFNVDTFISGNSGTWDLGDVGDYSGSQTFSIVLNTQGDDWTAEWLIGGTSVRSKVFVDSTTPAINYIGFGRNSEVGAEIDSLSLTVIPEPSSYALLAGCFGLTWVMLRRR